ncbi:hypothetical protein EX895_001937 [Sporisorium graminicola]|uniref:Uncharacterized protein n=1 Tax=Sporisorium graminicola TaxID=280036 RepID=A0A4U7KYI0_9BASI|nr:hypothetical protein EX895_001937 [Sporisorium graminicola]TKY89406.1 hypothetical protein EX895_001937 [Sporisorium graminicola]
MSQPSTAAIVVASIFGGIALIFVAYKAYRKLWHCMHRPEQLPPITQPPTAYYGGVVMSTVVDMPTSSYIERSASSTDYLAVSSPSTSTWPQGDGLASTSTSEMPSPSMRAIDSVVLSTPSEIYDAAHYRGTSTISSSSSTMTLKRSYLRSPSASQLSYMSTSSRRESYLPHSPLNRDSIQIIPPQPLGFGGTLAMATDQKTLAFSKDSGIGASDDFTSGLVWSERNPHRPQLAHHDRQRYLMQGPVSTRSSEAPSQLPSSQSSPVVQTRSLDSQIEGAHPFPAGAPLSQAPASTTVMDNTQPPPPSAEGLPKNADINPHLLSAKDSPLQRLQSNAGPARTPPHLHSHSDSNSNRSDSDASPILSPFVPPSGPPSTGNSNTSRSNLSSAAEPEGPPSG